MSPPLTAAVQALLRRLHSQQPLRGGSLIITIFGDAIAPRGGVATLGSLIRIAGVFRLSERLVRTSVARLANDGWLVARREGRQSEYRLTPGGQQRFAEATKRIYAAGPEQWDRQWTLVVLPAKTGAPREAVREELRWLGFGQLTPGTFAHPDCSLEQAREWLANIEGTDGALCLRSSCGEIAADRQVIAVGWDLGELTRRYRRFLATFEPVEAAVRSRSARREPGAAPVQASAPARESTAARGDAEAALIIRTLLIHEYRKIHLQDPLLPVALLPSDWVGAAAYELTRRLYSLVFNSAEEFLSATASTLDGPLPSPEPSVYERFGGASQIAPRHRTRP
jgi:phenylacetic acid degradation operon negative regulatory protein